MRFCLIDNSTLSGVQRLLGQIPVGNTIVSDMDILCMESLVQGILFYDEIIALDDYKEPFKQSRRQDFDFIRFISIPEITDKEILEKARLEIENIVPRVEGGQFKDKEFSSFFSLLKMNVTFTWDMRSSEYYLTQKMLAGIGGVDLEKYSRLSDAIYFELNDKRSTKIEQLEQKSVHLVASDGTPFQPNAGTSSDEKGLAEQASSFFAGLNWLAFRTIYFSLIATRLQVDLVLHPIRHSFHLSWLSALKGQNPSWYQPVIEALSGRANSALQEIRSSTQPAFISTEIPLFSAWLVNRLGDPAKIIEGAFELRKDKRLIAARNAFIKLDQIVEFSPSEYISESNKIIKNLDRALADIKSEFSIGTPQGNSVNTIIKAVNFGLQLTPWKIPNIPLDLLRSETIDSFSHKLQDRYVSPLYRSVVADLASVGRLGTLHEKLRSRVKLKHGASTYLSKTEEIQYHKKSSHWKRPM